VVGDPGAGDRAAPEAVPGNRHRLQVEQLDPVCRDRFPPPVGVVKARRTSFHLQRCSVLSQRITRHQAKWELLDIDRLLGEQLRSLFPALASADLHGRITRSVLSTRTPEPPDPIDATNVRETELGAREVTARETVAHETSCGGQADHESDQAAVTQAAFTRVYDPQPQPSLPNTVAATENWEVDFADLQNMLIECARAELKAFAQYLRAMKHGRKRGWAAVKRSSLTLTAVRQLDVAFSYRQDRLASLVARSQIPPGKLHDTEPEAKDAGGLQELVTKAAAWPHTVSKICEDLKKTKYSKMTSSSWLEHYNAACIYALALMDDEGQKDDHLEHAYAAVDALERALACGEDVDFVKAKRYWLQAGDPDLSGLRKYDCFLAFEARVYGRPFPADDLTKYEFYLYLRTVLEHGSRHLESEWMRRSALEIEFLPYHEAKNGGARRSMRGN
jgi:hypothetical protein